MQVVQKAFMTFKAIEADPFSLNRTSVNTPAAAQWSKSLETHQLNRDTLAAKHVIGQGQVCEHVPFLVTNHNSINSLAKFIKPQC